MFDFFGGIPRRLIFDNAKVAVKEGFGLYAKPQTNTYPLVHIMHLTWIFVILEKVMKKD